MRLRDRFELADTIYFTPLGRVATGAASFCRNYTSIRLKPRIATLPQGERLSPLLTVSSRKGEPRVRRRPQQKQRRYRSRRVTMIVGRGGWPELAMPFVSLRPDLRFAEENRTGLVGRKNSLLVAALLNGLRERSPDAATLIPQQS